MNSSTIIAAVVLVLILIPAMRGCILHLKGEGSCCGGPKEKPSRKKLRGPIHSKYRFRIDGIRCDGCRNRIQNALNRLDGVSARVSRSQPYAMICCSREVSEEELRTCVEQLSYKVSEIRRVK